MNTFGYLFAVTMLGCTTKAEDSGDSVPDPLPTITNSWGGEMIQIPAGTFEMGSGRGDPDNDALDHDVTLTHDFFLGRTEVSQGQWARFADAYDTAHRAP